MPHYQNRSHEELRFQDYELQKEFYISTKPWGLTGKACRGSREAPYSETPGDAINSGYSSVKIISISAMPHYQNRSHEELRLEDFELHKGTAGRGSREAPYSETPVGDGMNKGCSSGEIISISAMPHYQNRSHEELRFEDSELQKECRGSGEVPYSKTPKGDGINTGDSELQKRSSFPWKYPFKQSSCLSHPLNSPVPSSQPSFDSLRETTFGTSTAAYAKPTFGSISAVLFLFHLVVQAVMDLLVEIQELVLLEHLAPTCSVPQTTRHLVFSSIFGSQTSSGSMGTTETKYQGSRQGFSATEVVPRENESDVSKIQSISAMPIYEHKSHEELRSEDYGLCNTCCKEPSVIASSFIKSTPVISSDPCSSFVNASQPQQTAEEVGLVSNHLNIPSQDSSGLPIVTEFTSRNINGPQYTPSSNPIVQSVTSILNGIPTQERNGRSSETKLQVLFCIDEEATGSVAPLLPRKNPRAWLNTTSLSLCTPQESKGDEVKGSCSSVQITEINEEDTSALLNQPEVEVAATTERRDADVLALLPKLPDGVEYYTEPSLRELAAKEMAEAGFCRHVNDFVVGRKGHGSIKFLGETDVCHLDVETIVQLNNHQVIIYPNGRKKPGVGQQVNKAAEVTLLNVKCISKKTGKKYVEGPQVESYRERLIKMIRECGSEFDSYDPVEGELKFRVQLF
ncbi:nuclear pore complex protein NUP98B-like isoform X2 [Salvia divinorum]|uniref:Nuclear pore complex protein NUP98B-like isoform X2 n=1 Tax=Salvia divinorum TaxID=28513 RepID=A0ABD1FW95_SALDI